MTSRTNPGDAAPAVAEADLGAFFRHRADVPAVRSAGLIGSLSRLSRSDDPVVTFGGLPRVCVPQFADGCQVELADGTEPPFRATHPAGLAERPRQATGSPADPGQVLSTPFQVISRTSYPSYAGVVTHWWTGRAPSDSDAVIADLMVKHLVALVDHERLMTAVARAEDRAAALALEAISGRTISLATGIVMCQHRLAADDAESLLRRSAKMAGRSLHQIAASVVRYGSRDVS
jgi:hypothetical protein